MFDSPFLDKVSFVILSKEDAVGYQLHTEEESILPANVNEERKSQFILGRAAANQALRKLGHNEMPVLKGLNREPIWPAGTVGSITHTTSWACAVAALSKEVLSLGIDLQELRNIGRFDLAKRVCSKREQAWLSSDNNNLTQNFTKLFSAKESIYKAFYPIAHYSLGFKDVELSWDIETEGFKGELLVDISPKFPTGYRFFVPVSFSSGYVLSSIMIETLSK